MPVDLSLDDWTTMIATLDHMQETLDMQRPGAYALKEDYKRIAFDIRKQLPVTLPS